MRRVFASFSAAIVLSIFGALPVAADISEDARSMWDPYRASPAPAHSFDRQRVARATTSEDERTYDVRPGYNDDDEDEPRATRTRQPKSARSKGARRSAKRQTTRRGVRQASTRERQTRGQRRTRVVSLSGGSQIHGVASYYQSGHTTASGARYNPDGLTAAHRSLPFGTRVRVTHLGNGRVVNVTINDRGPFIGGRAIDLSRGAARVIGMIGSGLARVQVEILGR